MLSNNALAQFLSKDDYHVHSRDDQAIIYYLLSQTCHAQCHSQLHCDRCLCTINCQKDCSIYLKADRLSLVHRNLSIFSSACLCSHYFTQHIFQNRQASPALLKSTASSHLARLPSSSRTLTSHCFLKGQYFLSCRTSAVPFLGFLPTLLELLSIFFSKLSPMCHYKPEDGLQPEYIPTEITKFG